MAFFCFAAVLPAVTQTTVTTNGGTTNAVPKFTGSSTIGDSAITENSGNVGVGTNNPPEKLAVRGNIAKETVIGYDGTWDNLIKYGVAGDLESGTSQANRWIGIDATVTAGAAPANKMLFRVYGGTASNDPPANVMTLQGNGNVGIGTSSPPEKLAVRGNLVKETLTGYDGAWDNLIKYGVADDLESGTSQANRWIGVDATVTGTAASANKMLFRVYGGSSSNNPPVNVMTLQGDGNVGIGTTSPSYMLDVNGYIRARGAFVFPDGTFQTTAASGGGTITGVVPGTGLTGGGYSGNVTLSVDGTVVRSNASNTFTAGQTFNNYPLTVNHTVLVDREETSVYGVKATVLSGIAGGFWNKRSQDSNFLTGSVIAGFAGTGPTSVFQVDTYGTVRALNAIVAYGLDYAEGVRVNPTNKYEPGDVLVIDTTGSSPQFSLSTQSNSALVAGVYSTQPAMLATTHPMDEKLAADEVPIALVGQVQCKASAENGAINIGDLLVSSATPGHAMRAGDNVKPGTILGKALESLPFGTGKIRVLLTLH